ncbi:MAG TPA: hypothetical protein VHR47_12465 [Bacillota bacterium]|jgi:hypothetical protein|nr:hypothetical protein [Bacillota bacterium]
MGDRRVIHIDGAGRLVEELNHLYHEGKVKGLVIGVEMEDGQFHIGWTKQTSFLELMGLAATIHLTINHFAICPLEVDE